MASQELWAQLQPAIAAFLSENSNFNTNARAEIESFTPKTIERLSDESLLKKIDRIRKNILSNIEIRAQWDVRKSTTAPGEHPADRPRIEDFVPVLPAVHRTWTESWEGDGMRPGSNVRTALNFDIAKNVISPTGWQKPVQAFLEASAKFAGLSQSDIPSNMAEIDRRLKAGASETSLRAAVDEGSAVHRGDAVTRFTVSRLPVAIAAEEVEDAQRETFRNQRLQFLLTNLESDGGLVRLIDGAPTAPVVSGEEPTTETVQLQKDGSWNCPWVELSDWETVEAWRTEFF